LTVDLTGKNSPENPHKADTFDENSGQQFCKR
jgi:hypothetical protein